MTLLDAEKQAHRPQASRARDRLVFPFRQSRRAMALGLMVILMVITILHTSHLDPPATATIPVVTQSPAVTPRPPLKHDLPSKPPLLNWAQNLSSSLFSHGLSPSFPPPSYPATKDTVYFRGPTSWPAYTAMLDELVSAVLPPELQVAYRLRQATEGWSGRDQGWDGVGHRTVWQKDKDESKRDGADVVAWRLAAEKAGWKHDFNTNEGATAWVRKNLGGTRLEALWHALPYEPLKGDLYRYLVLALRGGLYSDTDTAPKDPAFQWAAPGIGVDLWRGGKGWMSELEVERVDAKASVKERDEEIEAILGRPNTVISVGFINTHYDGWTREFMPRPVSRIACLALIGKLEMVIWTITSTPYHPIILTCLLRVLQNTARKIDFAQAHYANYTAAASFFPPTEINSTVPHSKLVAEAKAKVLRLGNINVLNDPQNGGRLGVLEWTGPAVYTDSVFAYLSARYGLEWRELSGLQKPLRVGDVLILPTWMTDHRFNAGWKDLTILGH